MNPLAGQKAKKEIEKRRGDIKTYTAPIIFAGDLDRKKFYQAYHKKFNNSKKSSVYRLQVLRKQATTVGRLYHELVEHSGNATPEEFWQRYDYRCCDINRVMGELQAAKEASKKRKSQQKIMKKKSKDESKLTVGLPWMTIKSTSTARMKSSKKKVQESSIAAIDMAGTVDTADEECHHDSDYMQEFKRSIGGAEGRLIDASPSDTSKTVQEDESLEEPVGVASIFRTANSLQGKVETENKVQDSQTQCEGKGEIEDSGRASSPPLRLVGIWLLFALVASLLLEPHRWMSQQFGNSLCAPMRPGSNIDTSHGADTFTAPWWTPAFTKRSLFGHLCALDAQGNSRKRTQILTEMWPNRLLHRNDKHLSLKIIAFDDNGNEETLVKVPRISSFKLDSTGSKILVDHLHGYKEYDAPWALL
jgi:hypothetical protein